MSNLKETIKELNVISEEVTADPLLKDKIQQKLKVIKKNNQVNK